MSRTLRLTVLVVVVTIGSLAGAHVLSPAHAAADNPQSAACETDTLTAQTAVDAYFSDHGVYANGTGASNTGGTARTRAGQAVDLSALISAGYLHSSFGTDETFTFANSAGLVIGHVDNHKKAC